MTMDVFLMVTAHLECKICLSFKASSVKLKETFSKVKKEGGPGCFRGYSGAVEFTVAFLGFQEIACHCIHYL